MPTPTMPIDVQPPAPAAAQQFSASGQLLAQSQANRDDFAAHLRQADPGSERSSETSPVRPGGTASRPQRAESRPSDVQHADRSSDPARPDATRPDAGRPDGDRADDGTHDPDASHADPAGTNPGTPGVPPDPTTAGAPPVLTGLVAPAPAPAAPLLPTDPAGTGAGPLTGATAATGAAGIAAADVTALTTGPLGAVALAGRGAPARSGPGSATLPGASGRGPVPSTSVLPGAGPASGTRTTRPDDTGQRFDPLTPTPTIHQLGTEIVAGSPTGVAGQGASPSGTLTSAIGGRTETVTATGALTSGTAAATAAAAAADPATPSTTLTVAGQVAAGLRTLQGQPDGVHVVVVRLHPEDLGPVRVEARLTGNDIHLRLSATTVAAAAALSDAGPALHRALAGSGLNATGVVVDRDVDLSGQLNAGLGGHTSGAGHSGTEQRAGAGSGAGGSDRSTPLSTGGSPSGQDSAAPPRSRHPASSIDVQL